MRIKHSDVVCNIPRHWIRIWNLNARSGWVSIGTAFECTSQTSATSDLSSHALKPPTNRVGSQWIGEHRLNMKDRLRRQWWALGASPFMAVPTTRKQSAGQPVNWLEPWKRMRFGCFVDQSAVTWWRQVLWLLYHTFHDRINYGKDRAMLG